MAIKDMSELKKSVKFIMAFAIWLIVSQWSYGRTNNPTKGVVMVPEYYPLDSAIVYYADSVLRCPDYSYYNSFNNSYNKEQIFILCGEWSDGSPALCLYIDNHLCEGIIGNAYVCGYIKIGEKVVYLRKSPSVDALFQSSYGDYLPFEYYPDPPEMYYPYDPPEWYFGWRNRTMVYVWTTASADPSIDREYLRHIEEEIMNIRWGISYKDFMRMVE
ncbi:MAG: hypothetical protein LIP03_10600 [Bacteroidales bacterium]|nr:hypothetical protein [Bacteroidales bacterium]